MNVNDPTLQDFLAELFRSTKGDPEVNISMYDIGVSLGLEKAAAGKLAEEVIAEGWAQIKTLSGAIGITREGIEIAGKMEGDSGEEIASSLGNDPIVQEEARAGVEKMLEWIKDRVSAMTMDYDDIEAMVMDIKTVQIQLLSPKPKTAIIKEIFYSLQAGFSHLGDKEAADRIMQFLSE